MLFVILIVQALLADEVASVRPPERPVVPNITALSSTEVRITWCRVNSNKVEIDHYELFIDSELEYSGIDVMYKAKRLKPWSWYEVKLRACGISPSSCSPFSRPVLVKTLRDKDNSTMIQSGVTIFKVVVVPTYMFILGMLAGVLVISLGLMWRYFQCADLSSGSAFELPQYMHLKEQQAKLGTGNSYSPMAQLFSLQSKGKLPQTHSHGDESTMFLSKACQVDDIESNFLEIAKMDGATEESKFVISDIFSHFQASSSAEISQQGAAVQSKEPGTTIRIANGLTHSEETPQSETSQFSLSPIKEDDYQDALDDHNLYNSDTDVVSSSRNCTLPQPGATFTDNIQNVTVTQTPKEKSLQNVDSSKTANLACSTSAPCTTHSDTYCQLNRQRTTTGTQAQKEQSLHTADSAKTANLPYSTSTPCTAHSDTYCQLNQQRTTAGTQVSSPLPPQPGLVVAIDNSNIYIGAQECASTVNSSDRKRHVRVKLQNLVRILERERTKTRGFACGSSPPATEHVWEVYRRLGYTVDLEDRRGKDEQRVDEGLHLCIYKALCELPAGVLVLATGDGMKGKSECDTSFPGCAVSALERGWRVEVFSWKHSLSAEWTKLARKHPDTLTINYLDRYVNNITFVDGRYSRKCLPVPDGNVLQMK